MFEKEKEQFNSIKAPGYLKSETILAVSEAKKGKKFSFARAMSFCAMLVLVCVLMLGNVSLGPAPSFANEMNAKSRNIICNEVKANLGAVVTVSHGTLSTAKSDQELTKIKVLGKETVYWCIPEALGEYEMHVKGLIKSKKFVLKFDEAQQNWILQEI